MSTPSTAKPKKQRKLVQYARNIKDSYTISRRTYPWVGWALLGLPVLLAVIAAVLSLVTSQAWWYWVLMAVVVALTLDMLVLSWTVRRASYSQIEGMPGATKSVLDQLRRGWNIEQEPAAVNPRTQDVVWRMVGRPGVVLLAEAPPSRAHRMLEDEKKKVRRILPTVPVHLIQVGKAESQTRLLNLERTLRRLPTRPTKLTDAEIVQVAQRLRSLNSKGLPIPRGIDPMKVRPDRRAMRGR